MYTTERLPRSKSQALRIVDSLTWALCPILTNIQVFDSIGGDEQMENEGRPCGDPYAGLARFPE